MNGTDRTPHSAHPKQVRSNAVLARNTPSQPYDRVRFSQPGLPRSPHSLTTTNRDRDRNGFHHSIDQHTLMVEHNAGMAIAPATVVKHLNKQRRRNRKHNGKKARSQHVPTAPCNDDGDDEARSLVNIDGLGLTVQISGSRELTTKQTAFHSVRCI